MLRILKTIITGRMGGIITKEGLTDYLTFSWVTVKATAAQQLSSFFALNFFLPDLNLTLI